MKYPSIDERLKTISDLIKQRVDLYEYLELQRKVLQIQLEIDATQNKGARDNWNGQLSMSQLEEKALETKKPVVYFIDPAIFIEETLSSLFRRVVDTLISMYPDEKGLRKFSEQTIAKKIDLLNLIKAAMSEDETLIMKYAKNFEVEPIILLYLISTPVQPFIEELARRASPSFYAKWWQSHCPICGRIPNIARIRDRRRYLLCDFCGAEYLSDYFLCVHCENKDPYTLKYMKIDGKSGFQIDFCTKCKHYVKVIIENELQKPISRCAEDMLTLDLDIEAEHAGLVRT